jgi:hypothetical protein
MVICVFWIRIGGRVFFKQEAGCKNSLSKFAPSTLQATAHHGKKNYLV